MFLLLLQVAADLGGVADEESVRAVADKFVKAGTLTLCVNENLVLALGGDGGREMTAMSGMTGEGGAAADESQLLAREAGDALSNAFEDLALALGKEADAKKRRQLIEEFLGAQGAPACSAVVFSSSGEWVLAMGADGVDVEVSVCPLNVIASGARATRKAKIKYLFEAKKK